VQSNIKLDGYNSAVIVGIESTETAFQLQGILFHLHWWMGSSMTLVGWEASLTPDERLRNT
jgi:hypothetical protein